MITGPLYDWLKWIAQVVLPALGTLIFTIFQIWGLSGGTEIVGTIMAIDLFLGVLLGISQLNYNKTIANAGELVVTEEGKKLFQVDPEKVDFNNIGDKREVRFAVKKEGE